MLRILGLVVAVFTMSLPVHAGERYTETAGGLSYGVPQNWRVMEFPELKFRIVVTDPIADFSQNMTMVDERFDGSLSAYETAVLLRWKRRYPVFVL
ncbi:MAG: hypothetical protein OEX12_00710 [Gammaproteobacteria bacterium]|nr:hypothetical protein [Gammaproteobacteria bacterium]